MRNGKWWPWTVACGLVAALVAVLLLAGVPGTLPPEDIREWLVAVFAVGGPLLAVFGWAYKMTHDPPVTDERIDKAKDLLATAVKKQWTDEVRFRDWQKRPLIQVRWRAPVDPCVPSHPGAVKNAPQTASSAEVAELAENFRACEPRRLVILGGPGTGKTTLAVGLLLKLLDTRKGREDEPVPVILPVAQWDTKKYPNLFKWLSTQVYQDYHPVLRGLGVDGVRQLVTLGHVLPILDGLDELPETAQARVIECLNDSLGRDDQLVLTSRTTEYIDAVSDGRAVNSAAVLEPLPVTPLAAADYLTRSLQSHQASQPAWGRALEALRTEPSSALAEVAATPLGLWLLRAVYIKGDGDPDELTDPARFLTSDKLRAHLLGHLIAALLPPDGDMKRVKSLGLSRGYQAYDVKRWLAFLAHHLSNQPSQYDPYHNGTRDFDLWRLAATTGRTPSTRVVVLVAGLVIGLAVVSELMSGLMSGLMVGVWVGFAVSRSAKPPDGLDLRVPGRKRTLLSGLIRGFVFGLVGGLMYVLTFGFIFGCGLVLIRGRTPMSEIVSVLASRSTSGSGFGSIFASVLGFALGLAIEILDRSGTLSLAPEANSPQAGLRWDRTLNLARTICGCLVVGLTFGLVYGLMYGLVLGPMPGLVFGLAFLLVAGLVLGPMPGLVAPHHRAWLPYVWATWRLSREGVLPRKLMPFLDDMHRLGLLRAVGRIYQFRHAELQDHLAEAYQRAD